MAFIPTSLRQPSTGKFVNTPSLRGVTYGPALTPEEENAQNRENELLALNQKYALARIGAQNVPSRTTTSSTPVMPSWEPPPSYDMPEYTPYIPGAAPTYEAPEWDEGAISSLTQNKAAPGLRELRQQIQRVSGRKYDNPQVGRMTLREALQGYGSGVGSVMSSASGVARGEYGQRYGIEADVAKTNFGGAMSQWQGENQARTQAGLINYQAEAAEKKSVFDSAWDRWKASIGTSTTSATRY